jgi:hypothetical protein
MLITIGIGTLAMALLVGKFYSPSMAIQVYKSRIEPQLREKIKREDISDLLTEKDWSDLDRMGCLKLEEIYDLRQRISEYVSKR